MNARKGIKTQLFLPAMLGRLRPLKTMNARKGIKTEWGDEVEEVECGLKTMNARKGIMKDEG